MRRIWISLALMLAVCAASLPTLASGAPPPVNFPDGVASGDVTKDKVILWTRADGPGDVTATVYKDAGLTQVKKHKKKKTDASRDFTVKIDIGGLKPGTQYWYQFTSGPNSSPTGSFKTAPKREDAEDVHFGYTGDFDVTRLPTEPTHSGAPSHPGGPPFGTDGVNGGKTLNALAAENPDFWSYLGDTVYQDSAFRSAPAQPGGPGPAMTLDQYRETYKELRSYAAVNNIMAQTSTYALWDDHEVYNDFDSETVDPVRYANGRKAFLENMPIRETGLLHDPSCGGDPMYRKFSWGSSVDLFVLDERSCRSQEATAACFGDLAPTLPQAGRQTFPFSLFLTPTPPAGCLDAINDPSRTLLGRKQKERFKKDLAHSEAQYKFVLNQDPIMQQYVLPYDRWEGYAAERNEILDFIRDREIANVEFLTTDQHATVQSDVYKDFFSDPGRIADEMVTGPIGVETYQQEVIAQAGPVGLFAVNSAYTAFTRTECKNFNKYSYAKVDVTAGGTTTNTSKDDTGTPIVTDAATPSPVCSDTYGP